MNVVERASAVPVGVSERGLGGVVDADVAVDHGAVNGRYGDGPFEQPAAPPLLRPRAHLRPSSAYGHR